MTAAAADKKFQISNNRIMKEFGPILTWQGAMCKPQILFYCFETTDQQNNKSVQCSCGQELGASKQQHIHLTALLYAVVARETDTDTVHMREVCSLSQEPNSRGICKN
jgi:hypothetical protein